MSKLPATDSTKASKAGRMKVIRNEETNRWATHTEGNSFYANIQPGDNQLKEVFRDGELLVDVSLEDVRGIALRGSA